MSMVVSGYYGKLPLSPEFLRLHATGAEIRWLDEWLQQGVLYAKAKEGPQWVARVAASSIWRFVLVPADQGRVVCGVLFPSQDKAGRSFPFLSFLLLDRTVLDDQPWLIPLVASEYLKTAEAALHSLRQGGEWQVFQRQVHDWNEPLVSIESAARTFDRYLRETTASSWIEGLGEGEEGGAEQQREGRIRQVADRIAGLRAGQSRVAVQCPLTSTSMMQDADMAFWLAACLQGRAAVQGPHSGVFSVWRHNGEPGASSALISLGPGSPHVVRVLVSPEADDESWQPLVPREIGPGKTELDHELQALKSLTDSASSLQTLLDFWQADGRTGGVRSDALT